MEAIVMEHHTLDDVIDAGGGYWWLCWDGHIQSGVTREEWAQPRRGDRITIWHRVGSVVHFRIAFGERVIRDRGEDWIPNA